jgi:hypothetical protein
LDGLKQVESWFTSEKRKIYNSNRINYKILHKTIEISKVTLRDGVLLLFSYPTTDQKLLIPEIVIHGTTNVGVELIKKHGILSRGFNLFGKPKRPSSLDFGEGFYCTYNNNICRDQVYLLSKTRASNFPGVVPCVISIRVHPDINQDSSLKCVYYDGDKNTDGLEWASFVVHHRVLKLKFDAKSLHVDN